MSLLASPIIDSHHSTLSRLREGLRFHLRHAWFNIQEQFSDLGSGLVGFLLFPFYVWLVARLWSKFNSYQGNYTFEEVIAYLGATEILFMTFLRSQSLSRASSDFSLSLARPRSWMVMSFSGLFGRCLGSRIVFLLLFLLIMPLLGVDLHRTLEVAGRLILFFPLLGIFQGLIGQTFAIAEVLWMETFYFILPVSKIFLALGGVFGPIADFSEPWKSVLLALPPSDVFFQPAHFCLRGSFYGMSPTEWVLRVSASCVVLMICNQFFYRYARRHHQSYGG